MTRLFDLIRGLVGLLLIIAMLAGVPALLLVIVGYPLPTRLPPVEVIQAHIEDGDIPDAFLIKTLALVIWFVWAQLAIATLVELVAVARGRLSRRAPVLPGVQLFAGKLVASTMLIISAFSPSRTLAAAPIVAPDVAQAPLDASLASTPPVMTAAGLPAPVGPGIDGIDGREPVGERDGLAKAAAPGFYTTKSGDNWWDVAERLLGDGMRWSELRSINSGRTMLTGDVVDNRTEAVRSGWQLLVPADADPSLLDALDVLDPSAIPESGSAVGADASPIDPAVTAGGAGEIAASETGAGTDGGGTPMVRSVDADRTTEAGAEWSLVHALRPETLVFEGPTGAERVGAGPAYQVVEGDNLWDIAERHLGDPFRWPEIYEASTDLTQTFGRQITDPNLIWPDSILVLPGDATDVPIADADLVVEVLGQRAVASDPEPTVPDGVEEPSTGELHELAEEAAAAAEAAAADGSGESNDDAPVEGPVATEPVRSAEPGPGDPSGPDGGDELPIGDAVPAGALALAGGGALLATGLLGLLSRARRLRLAETGEASIPAPPPLELVDVETVLRNRADPVAVAALASAVASLAVGATRSDEPLLVPEVVRVGADRIEVIIADTAAPIPAPWREVEVSGAPLPPNRRAIVAAAEAFAPVGPTSSDDPTGDDAATPHPGSTDRSGSTPTMVTVGDGVLINLEAIGLVGLDGRPESVAGLARAVIHELGAAATTGFGAQPVDVIVSDRLAGIGIAPGARTVTAERLTDDLAPWLDEVELGLAASGADGPLGLRLVDGPSGAIRSVVVVVDGSELVDGQSAAALLDRAIDRRLPLAIVAIGPVPGAPLGAGMTITAEPDLVRLEPLGLSAVAIDLELDLILGAEALIDHARRAPIVPRPEIAWAEAEIVVEGEDPNAIDGLRPIGAQAGPQPDGSDPAQRPTEETPEHEIVTERPADDDGDDVTDRSDDHESGLLIRVLGPVLVEGGPGNLSEVQTAIVAFLALAGPSTLDQIAEAIAPERPDDRVMIEAEIEVLDHLLGPLFPKAGDGRHRVRSTITDLGSARRWIAQAGALSEDRARNLLQLALSEVRGRPFAGVDQRWWQWVEDHRLAIATQATSLLMDACFDLCDSAYSVDDFHLANWACEIGSMIDPLHETAVTRQAQLLGLLGRADEAAQVVTAWELAFAASAGRPAPHGPRIALDSAPPPGDHAATPRRDQEVATHVG